MSEFKGTPGPWNGKDVGICQQDRAGLQLGFITYSNEEQVSECAANAMLIAAAPDLLEALQECIYRIDSLISNGDEVYLDVLARDKARAAISKATGE